MNSRNRKKRAPDQAPEIPIAPMIDCVFLLLVYFMVTSSLEKEEADLAMALPAKSKNAATLLELDEQIVRISSAGEPMLNGAITDKSASRVFKSLIQRLRFFRESSKRGNGHPQVLLVPDKGTEHRFIVRVLDAIETAGIERVQFGMSP